MEATIVERNTIISTNCRTQEVRIDSIMVLKRIRQNVKDIDTLADDIKWNGLINPPTVLDNGDETYTLITGLRRLRACQQLEMAVIRVTILTAIEADDMLALEFAENEQRQDFTAAERLEYAEKIKEIERRRGRERMSYARHSDHDRDEYSLDSEGRDHGPYLETGRARDVIAQKAGFSSGRQYERIAKIADVRPDLLEKLDNGELTVRQAYSQAFPAQSAEQLESKLVPNVKGNGEGINIAGEAALPHNAIQFPSRNATVDALADPDDCNGIPATPGKILQFSSRGIAQGAASDIDARKAELEAEAEADRRAYNLTKAYTNTICAVIQLPTTPDAVYEWIRFAGMDRDEVEGTLSDVRLACERLSKLADTFSACLRAPLLR